MLAPAHDFCTVFGPSRFAHRPQPSRSGCTAITFFVRGNKAYLSWLGDSAAILSRGGKHVTLMDPHKPVRAYQCVCL